MIRAICLMAWSVCSLTLCPLWVQAESPSPKEPKGLAKVAPPPITLPSPQKVAPKTEDLTENAKKLKIALDKRKDLVAETRTFYKDHLYEPAWIKGSKLTTTGLHALQILKNAAIEGLNPDDYQKAFKIEEEKDQENADITLTNELIRFIKHVRVGRVSPEKVSDIIKIKSPKTDPIELINQALKDPKLLDHLGPTQMAYQNLKNLLATFQTLLNKNPSLPVLKDINLKKGMSDPEVINLRKILIFYGDLKKDALSNEFDLDVEEALKNFQKRHYLESDGVVGKDTRKALNMTLQERINTIIVNMERWRWLPDDLSPKYIIVNVAGFEVTAVKDDQVDLRIKAIVGAPITKTPLFYAPLQNIIINPDWNVPAGVMARQKLQKLINDPGYAYQAGMTVLDSTGNPVDPYQVDWEHEGMSYHLRQHSGARNALGRIKLNIKNPYTVYLHGTPEDKLFNYTIRGFSSGCVRLQKPVELAAWVFGDDKKWSVDKINGAINTGVTRTVPLSTTIPVYFTYQTTWIDEANTLYFANDHYHLDPPLMRLLKLPGITLEDASQEDTPS